MRSQNLLFSYLAWWFSSSYFRGEKYLVASQSRSWNQACNPAWSMGQGGDFGFLPYWWFLIIYLQVPGKCLFVKTVASVDRNLAGSVSCGGSGCIFLLPLRIVLHIPQWQPLCSLKLMHESYSSWQKMQGETEHENLNAASPGTLRPWISKEFEKGFTNIFIVVLFLLLPCLGLYNFPVFIWYGLVCRVLRPPRKGTYIKEAWFFFFFFIPELRL